MGEIKKYVRFYLHKRGSWPDQSSQRPRNVVLSFNRDGMRLFAPTGLKIAASDWDLQKQRVKLTVKRGGEVNRYLDQLEQKINDIYYKAKADGLRADNHYLLGEMKKDGQQVRADLFKEWNKFVDINRNRFATGTIKSMMTAYHRFKEFTGGRRMSFEDVTPELLAQYAGFLLGVGNVNITIHGNIKRLKIFLNYAKDRGLHSNESYKKFRWKVPKTRIFFLDWSEVKTLYDYQPASDFERKVLDKWLFGALTAIRFSDYDQLLKSQCRKVTFPGQAAAYHAAFLNQKKSFKPVVVPLLPEAMSILARYTDQPGELALPKVGAHVINRHIKLIARKAGITGRVIVESYKGNQVERKEVERCDLIGTHTGRKSFITHALDMKIADSTVADISGHDVKTMNEFYAGIVDRGKFVKVMKDMSLTADTDNKDEVE
jgi:Phage integrase SAM-like domain/Arm DNA-binding domain